MIPVMKLDKYCKIQITQFKTYYFNNASKIKMEMEIKTKNKYYNKICI